MQAFMPKIVKSPSNIQFDDIQRITPLSRMTDRLLYNMDDILSLSPLAKATYERGGWRQ